MLERVKPFIKKIIHDSQLPRISNKSEIRHINVSGMNRNLITEATRALN